MSEQETPIHELFSHIEPWALPARWRLKQFEAWVLWADGADDDGNLLGWCPLHDQDRKTEGSAEFNFLKSIMRCQGDPCCHEKRAMSLDNVWVRMQDGAK